MKENTTFNFMLFSNQSLKFYHRNM